ncbi:hypothetical protein M422DRAFT_201862 [Sphaerobolus stellatus SS14]|nr:hypothetical protein M422DRAFT_201862 [Sphaerobolus stellatus SS14]
MPVTTAQVLRAMERIAPLRLAEKWDTVGLLIEAPFPRPKATRILLTIDLTPAVLEEALSVPTSMIISYHTPLFRPVSSLTLSNPLQASLLKCAASGISVYSPHTALDTVNGGINDWLARAFTKLGKSSTVSAVGPKEGEESSIGTGRIVTLAQSVPLSEVVTSVKEHLGLKHVQVASISEMKEGSPGIKSIAICAGSGGSMLLGVKADLYFTGEMAHHEILASISSGTNVILCGHDNTERGFLPFLKEKLQAVLAEEVNASEYEVFVSTQDRHPLTIV